LSKLSSLIDIWFTEDQLRSIRFALNSYKHDCGYIEKEEIDLIVDHINHILKDKNVSQL